MQEELKTTQADLEASLIKIVTAPEPFPLPGRPVRRLVANCLKALYTRGETRTLFDTIQAFLKLLAETKPPAKESSRVYVSKPFVILPMSLPQARAAVYCIGELMGVFGAQVRVITYI